MSWASILELAIPKAALMLSAPADNRFEELGSLVEGYLLRRMSHDPEMGRAMASRLLDVYDNCDAISYDEPGTGEAYALLHFLDRYHRFQLTLDLLARNKLMPLRQGRTNVLDIGTGPGPSMFAVSDFYCERFGYVDSSQAHRESPGFKIDYVEKSIEFRQWLHHFTEYANFYAPTKRYWFVPYHHGTFRDFGAIEFDEQMTSWDQDDDGDYQPASYIRSHRFDLIILSNFLTNQSLVQKFKKELRACARFLRHNGILVVVGAPFNKYRQIYDAISEIILGQGYGSRRFIAWCERVEIKPDVLSYRWGDAYGEQVKKLRRAVFAALEERYPKDLPEKAARKLSASIKPENNGPIEWQVLVFRKCARPRLQNRRPKPGNTSTLAS
jgi:SAM-dependent methyltransferase